ncbi:site-specific integrase [Hoeflea alexandrii]|uniref:site-specific integrase n=1 Tax=Hoeflea alexandrii TaxID=288436 RepID=UPI0022AE5CDB|nr:site-specific integrase [Hoeflea alexandrii]MCZ4290990.1 tyrosine-type recombinase/integrase [Hoeflea alexandrii]
MAKLTKSVVDAAAPREKQYTIWCSDLKGFGLFVQASGVRTYFVDYRNSAGVRRRMTIGRHGTVTTEQARKLAIATLGEAVRGVDPAAERRSRRGSITMKELCEQYLELADKGLILGKGDRPKKGSTLYTDKGRVYRHIVPLLGSKLVKDIKSADVSKFIRDVAAGKTAITAKTANKRGKSIVKGGLGTAARTAGLLGGILSHAVSEGIIERNPAQGVRRPADQRRTRRLNREEYRRLGQAIEELAGDETDQAILAVKLLALTGCRLGEIARLRWSEVDSAAQCFRLADSKEGASVRPVGKVVLEVLGEPSSDAAFVLAGARKAESFGGLPKAWQRIARRAGLVGVTPHTLRHSFASVAGDLGYSEPTIGAMLGHSAGSVTSRYIHHLDEVLAAATDRVSETIAEKMFEDVAEGGSSKRARAEGESQRNSPREAA